MAFRSMMIRVVLTVTTTSRFGFGFGWLLVRNVAYHATLQRRNDKPWNGKAPVLACADNLLSSWTWNGRRTPRITTMTPLTARLYSGKRYFGSSNSTEKIDDGDSNINNENKTDENDCIATADNSLSIRLDALHAQLSLLGVNGKELYNSALQSVQDPSKGYNDKFGKSAIKTYRAFLLQETTSPQAEQLHNELKLYAMASRVARQIVFLIQRHKSSQTEWVRHLDAPTMQETSVSDTTTTSTTSISNTITTFPLILVLDNVRSAFNVGSLFRTADATGCCLVLTIGITPHPGGNGADKLAKSALGAEHRVHHVHFATLSEALAYLRQNKKEYTLFGMETTEKSQLYTTISYPKNGCALILGNEVTGVDTEIMPLLDELIEIPMYGTKNSLNIAACAPVVLYEILRQWNCEEEHG